MTEELKDFWAKALKTISRGVVDKKHPFNKAVFATVFKERVNQRTVVHRSFEANNTSLFYTDSRSKKVMEIEGNPISSLLFYDPKSSLQVSVAGLSSIHEMDELAEAEQSKVQHFNDYSNSPFPGVAIEKSTDFSSGEINFMVVKFHWLEVDVLQLSREGHKRAIMRRDEDKWNGTFVVP